MTLLTIGLAVFILVHFIPRLKGLRSGLVNALGDNGYRGLFSVLSLAGLGLIIYGYSIAEYADHFEPPLWGRHATMLAVLIAFILFAAANMKGYIRKIIGHPMVFGLGLWATGHLLANGDLASVLLFGAFLLYAIISFLWLSMSEARAEFTPHIKYDAMAIIGGTIVYGVVLFLHPYIIGVPVIG